MTDRRIIKSVNHETDDLLLDISDTDILLNFNDALKALYPYLIRIQANAYDAWDDIVNPLFYQMVYATFEFKYGIMSAVKNSHRYDHNYYCYKIVNHIECIPKSLPVAVFTCKGWGTTEENTKTENLESKSMVFKSFGDGRHFLSLPFIAQNAVGNVTFDLVKIDLIDSITGIRLNEPEDGALFVRKEDVLFEFVAEI